LLQFMEGYRLLAKFCLHLPNKLECLTLAIIFRLNQHLPSQ
jgi:hypothetical protein